jgi:hypothetical protein
MSDLKKILKEEYAKKKLNITPKLLMEMIEEAMLAEATMTRLDLLKRDNDSKLRTMIKDGNKIQLKDGSSVKIKNDQSAQDYITALVAGKPTSNLYFNTVGGKKIKLSQIQKTGTPFSTSGGKKGLSGNVSERFESNIIVALAKAAGKDLPAKLPGEDLNPIRVDQDPDYQKAADKLVTNLKLTPGIYFKPGNGTVSDLYKYFKVINPTPKTDIADMKGGNRISVKKKGGGFLSSEVNETRALIAVALGFNKLKDLQNSDQYNDLFNELAVMLGKDKWNAAGSPDERRKLGNDALEMIYEAVEGKIDEHQAKIVEEAMTGNNRFTTPVSVANKLLTWDLNGTGKYHNDLGAWAKQNSNNFKFDIRWRGRGRAAGYRIDSTKSDQFIKKMNELYGIKSEEGRVDEREALKDLTKAAALATAMITGSPPAGDQTPQEPPAIQIDVSDKADDVELKVVSEELKKIFIEELLDAPNYFDGKISYEGDESEKET